MQRTLSIALAVLPAALAAGCSEPPLPAPGARPVPQLERPVVRAATPVSMPAQEPQADAGRVLADKVKRALEGEPTVHAAAIDVSVAPGGKVTLWGTAESEDEKLLAARVAYRIPGVNKVDNRLVLAGF